MIKKIPIKGISRDPSGQIAADGFCAESLNVQLDMGEVAPAIRPEPVTDASGNEIHVDGDILFIHKGINYENLIYRNSASLSYIATIGDASEGIVYPGLGSDEVVNGITAVGNTLVVSTDKDMYYILWKEGSYHYLGNRIPSPAIYFRMGGLDASRRVPNLSNVNMANISKDRQVGFVRNGDEGVVFAHENVGDKTAYGSSSKKYVFDYDFDKGIWNGYLDTVWGEIDRLVREQSRLGKAVYPMFVRYAVRLYDGTLYSQSIPILLGADIDKFADVVTAIGQLLLPNDEHAITYFNSYVEITSGYSIVMNADGQTGIFDGWDDIVKAVDVFVSPQIAPLQRNAAKFTLEYEGTITGALSTMYGYAIKGITLDPYYTVENQEKMVLNYQGTYLAKSFSLDEYTKLNGDKTLEIDVTSDGIMAQEALKETPQSMHYTRGGKLFNYNKRLVMTGSEQIVSSGYEFLHSVSWENPSSVMTSSFRFVYYLRGENGENVVISRDVNGNALIPRQRKAVVNGNVAEFVEDPRAWLAYPDSRCYRIDVYESAGTNVRMSSYMTKVFDQADVAFVFLGLGSPVMKPGISVEGLPTYENRTYLMQNSLVVSKVNNPFVFPAEDVVTFTAGEVMNMAVATTALSEGQFGQFPLYVFTDEGVFALSVDDEGKFRTNHPVTRDILLSDDALVGIEQGVFFAAKRGLLLLQGSRVTKVSAEMDGHSQTMGEEMEEVLDTEFGIPIEKPLAFHQYLRACSIAYDYANSRIILMNPFCNTQYVYKFDTQSWHRICVGKSYPVRALNSYPEAHVVMKDGRFQTLLDFSVLAESDVAQALPGVIYSRDLDLDASDIYKTVYNLKVRGRFADRHVRWQLQGSNDGLNYSVIHSLRGPSWKWYRIVLVTNLAPEERVSYVELNYEPRFTDKTR